MTDIVPLVRFTLHQEATLVPFQETVEERFKRWIRDKNFTPEQRRWLEDIRDHVAGSLQIEADDFDLEPFAQRGGLGAAAKAFGSDFPRVLDELNGVLAA